MTYMYIEQMINNNEIFCSVVMPVHNGERFLRQAIESVLNQTFTNFEFLIIENCSTDSSVEIIKTYNDERIRLIIETDCGQVQAYNRGFREAKGLYIFIVDHDDVSNSERFIEQLKYSVINRIDICGSYFNLIDQNGEKIGHIEMPINHTDIVDELLYKNSAIFNSSICVKKNVFEKLGDFDALYYPSADYDFYLKGIVKFVYGNVPQYLYSWRQHPQQISNIFVKDCTRKTISISLKNKKYFPNKMRLTYTGLVYYYNDKLLTSLYYFFIALFSDKITQKLLRYFFIALILGIPLKIFRKFNLVNSKIFLFTKGKIDFFIK